MGVTGLIWTLSVMADGNVGSATVLASEADLPALSTSGQAKAEAPICHDLPNRLRLTSTVVFVSNKIAYIPEYTTHTSTVWTHSIDLRTNGQWALPFTVGQVII